MDPSRLLSLPPELQFQIIAHLPYLDRLRLAQTSRGLRRVCTSEHGPPLAINLDLGHTRAHLFPQRMRSTWAKVVASVDITAEEWEESDYEDMADGEILGEDEQNPADGPTLRERLSVCLSSFARAYPNINSVKVAIDLGSLDVVANLNPEKVWMLREFSVHVHLPVDETGPDILFDASGPIAVRLPATMVCEEIKVSFSVINWQADNVLCVSANTTRLKRVRLDREEGENEMKWDLGFLRGADLLEKLWIDGNVYSLDSITHCTNLGEVRFDPAEDTDLSPLTHLERLTSLDVSLRERAIDTLPQCPHIRSLTIHDLEAATTFSPLLAYPNITKLHIEGDNTSQPACDALPLICPNLQSFTYKYTHMGNTSDINVTFISKMQSLEYLHLHVSVSDNSSDWVVGAPGCLSHIPHVVLESEDEQVDMRPLIGSHVLRKLELRFSGLATIRIEEEADFPALRSLVLTDVRNSRRVMGWLAKGAPNLRVVVFAGTTPPTALPAPLPGVVYIVRRDTGFPWPNM